MQQSPGKNRGGAAGTMANSSNLDWQLQREYWQNFKTEADNSDEIKRRLKQEMNILAHSLMEV